MCVTIINLDFAKGKVLLSECRLNETIKVHLWSGLCYLLLLAPFESRVLISNS